MEEPAALRVLVVDDDAEALAFVERVLRAHGDEVHTTRDPGEAIAVNRSSPAELVLVSLTLPNGGGLALVHHLRALNPDSDLIVVASSRDPNSVAQAAALGVAQTVLKPLSGDDLLVAVDRVRERRFLLSERADHEAERGRRQRRARAYRRCLPFVEESEPSLLPEMVVDVLADELAADWVALYIPDPDDAKILRLAASHGEGAPAERTVASLPERDALRHGEVVRVDEDGRRILVPLHAGHLLVGLAEIECVGEAPDVESARVIGDLAAAALRNARRFEALAKSGLKDPETSAYTFAYFVDHAGREIDKARRYGRQFSLGILTIDALDAVRTTLGGDRARRTSLDVVEAILEVVRDTDVVARVEEDEIYVFMPETGLLGALTCRRRLDERLSGMEAFQDIARETPMSVTMGLATYPADGLDLSMLLRKCRRSADRSRRSLVRRLSLDAAGFWQIAELLVGNEEQYAAGRDGRFFLHRDLAASEDESGSSRHALLTPAFLDRMVREMLREANRRPSVGGVLYADAGTSGAPSPLLGRVPPEPGAALHAWVLGVKGAGHDEQMATRAVWLDDPRLSTLRFVLHLGERGSYALIARPTSEGDLATFHTSEADLVEALVVRLQAEYHLQRASF